MPGCKPPVSETVAFWQFVADDVVVVPPVVVVVVDVELPPPPPHAESTKATMIGKVYF
ncbi:MAG: hypothetical protein RLY82_438 [Pseudomonadota bacterium]